MRRILAVLALVTACSDAGKADPKKVMTQRQRDSAIGETRLPGAPGVKGALRVQDSAAARNARLDTLQ
ncbi:MAG: hypothetical protein EXR93_08950 [Gemmatimonadetes bacterium]|nr:hypothetical protein [Gemmatimonadota bacterium]